MQLQGFETPKITGVITKATAFSSLTLAVPPIEKIAQGLGRAGFLETQWGWSGRLRLTSLATEILNGEVVRLTEGPPDLVVCFNNEQLSAHSHRIGQFSRAREKATRALLEVLENLILSDIAADEGEPMAHITQIEKGIVAPMREAR